MNATATKYYGTIRFDSGRFYVRFDVKWDGFWEAKEAVKACPGRWNGNEWEVSYEARTKLLHAARQHKIQAVGEAAARQLGCDFLYGGISIDKKQAMVDRFQSDPETGAIVLSIHAAGVGFNLTAARYGIFVEMDFNPGNNDQAAKRFHRIGQRNSVIIEYLIGKGTVDEYLWQLVEGKREAIDAVTEGSVGVTGEASESVVKRLWEMLKQGGNA